MTERMKSSNSVVGGGLGGILRRIQKRMYPYRRKIMEGID